MQRVSTVLLDLTNTLAATKIWPASVPVSAPEFADNPRSLMERKEPPGILLLCTDRIDSVAVTLCGELRLRFAETLLIALSSAPPDEEALVRVLEAGADECVALPRSLREAQARLAAWNRRKLPRVASGKAGSPTDNAFDPTNEASHLYFDNHPQPVFIYDLETYRFLSVNKAALLAYGYRREEFLDMTLLDIHPPEEIPSLRKNVEGVRNRPQDELDHAGVWRHILKDGTTIYVEITSHPVEYNGRRAEIVLAYDVTRRHQVERSLRQSQERFAAFMRHLPGVAFIKDAEGRYVFANSGWENLFELNFAKSQGKSDHELFPPDMADEFVANDRRVRNEGRPLLTHEHIEKNARRQHWLVTKFPMTDDDNPVAHLGGVAIDVTREVQARETLQHRENELRKAHELLNFHVENSPLAVVEWDSEFRVIRWSGRAEELFGWTESEVAQRHPTDWPFVFPEDREKVGKIMESLLNRDEPRNICTNRNFLKDGGVVYCEWYNSVRFDSDGRVASIFSLVHDITVEVEAKEEIVRFNAELEQRVADRTARLQAINDELESFSYSVSHDLRAPLRGIDGFARALEETAAENLDADARAYLQRIRNAAARMGELIDDLLELSRISRMKIEKRQVDLSALTGEILESFRETEPGRSVRPRILPEVSAEGDPRLLRIMLENLLNNAWKFTSQTAAAEIEFGVDNTRNGAKVYYVRDNGVGFDMRYAHKLFGPFQRLHSVSDFPGTGIGLATVKRVIQLHGGSVWAQSSPDRGATFYFKL